MILIGEKLKRLRTEMGLTQTQMSELLDVTVSAVSGYESDARHPSYGILISYARIFHVSTDYLLGVEKWEYVDVSGMSGRDKEAVQQVAAALRKFR